VDLRAGLDDMEKRKFLPPPRLELRPLGRPARSQSLYRLSYIIIITYAKDLDHLVLRLVNWRLYLYYKLYPGL
jgi:hypothetical protein